MIGTFFAVTAALFFVSYIQNAITGFQSAYPNLYRISPDGVRQSLSQWNHRRMVERARSKALAVLEVPTPYEFEVRFVETDDPKRDFLDPLWRNKGVLGDGAPPLRGRRANGHSGPHPYPRGGGQSLEQWLLQNVGPHEFRSTTVMDDAQYDYEVHVRVLFEEESDAVLCKLKWK
jgi:hypothetical protein